LIYRSIILKRLWSQNYQDHNLIRILLFAYQFAASLRVIRSELVLVQNTIGIDRDDIAILHLHVREETSLANHFANEGTTTTSSALESIHFTDIHCKSPFV